MYSPSILLLVATLPQFIFPSIGTPILLRNVSEHDFETVMDPTGQLLMTLCADSVGVNGNHTSSVPSCVTAATCYGVYAHIVSYCPPKPTNCFITPDRLRLCYPLDVNSVFHQGALHGCTSSLMLKGQVLYKNLNKWLHLDTFVRSASATAANGQVVTSIVFNTNPIASSGAPSETLVVPGTTAAGATKHLRHFHCKGGTFHRMHSTLAPIPAHQQGKCRAWEQGRHIPLGSASASRSKKNL
ncbi:hypothetical protein B0H10DRAFT_1958138 [Mycena sp. CBHHK59/15]|nr:hypothetical protein B0H10DRAFT_1958138 [Mycena sp. CBHHK59/15]